MIEPRPVYLIRALVLATALLGTSIAQAPPDADIAVLRPELVAMACPERPVVTTAGFAPTLPLTPEQEATRDQRAAYRDLLTVYLARVPSEPDAELLMPVEGVRVSQVANTYLAPRAGGRSHQGQDIFAPRHTPVRSATRDLGTSLPRWIT